MIHKPRKPPPSTRPLPSFTDVPNLNNHLNISTTTVHLLQPPLSHSPALPFIIATTKPDQFHHPLTLKPNFLEPSVNFDLTKLDATTLAVSYHSSPPFDKILVYPPPKLSNPNYEDCTLLALSNGGRLRGRIPSAVAWENVYDGGDGDGDLYDDIIIFDDDIYELNWEGKLYLVTSNIAKIIIVKPIINEPLSIIITPLLGQFRYRKRLVSDGNQLYLVVRVDGNLLRFYELLVSLTGDFSWLEVKEFGNRKVLFMARDYYFFRSTVMTGSDYENCIVFTEGAFPKFVNIGWEFSQNQDDILVFRLSDGTFAREGDHEIFPKLDWSPPPWIFHDSEESYSHSYSKPEEDDLDSNSEDEEDGKMQCDLKSREKEDGQMHCHVNIESGASLQEDVPFPLSGHEFETTDTATSSVSADKEVARTLLDMNGGNDAAEQGNSTRNITQSVPRACTCSTTKGDICDSPTAKFEGFDVRRDLIPTLQKIWQKHGNIIENSTMSSGGILARALESLAIVVQTLCDNSTQSLSDSEADCLRSTLADLKCICFKVDWLVPFVEKALKLHKSKPLLDFRNNLSQLSSQVKKRRAILFEELAKLGKEENKLKEEIAKVSKMIPISGEVKFDEPLGMGLI